MATPTLGLRHVWKEVNDGNGDVKVLALQRWFAAEGDEDETIVRNGGYWEDVDILPGDYWLDRGPVHQ